MQNLACMIIDSKARMQVAGNVARVVGTAVLEVIVGRCMQYVCVYAAADCAHR